MYTAVSIVVDLSISLTFVCLSLDVKPFRQGGFSFSTLRRRNGKRRQPSEVKFLSASPRRALTEITPTVGPP